MLKVIKKWLSGEDENQFPSPFTNKILQYCNALDWNVSIHSEMHITVGFSFDDDRTQLVHISHTGQIAEQEILQISSAVAKLDDIEDQLDQDFFNELLKLNALAPNYSWAIETIDEEVEYLVASSDQVLDTLDVNELAVAVYIVASAADEMESRFGLDNY